MIPVPRPDRRVFSRALDVLAGGLWWLACAVEDLVAHRHDEKKRYP